MSSFKVFPATLTADKQKVPLITGWQEKASNDPEQITRWRELFRDRLRFFGIPCGPVNNILVLDVDVKTNGFKTIQDNGLILPDTLSQGTLNGGKHFFFRYPNTGKHYTNRVGFMPGLDIRSAGGWVAFWGIDIDWSKPIFDPPPWLLERITRPAIENTGPVIKIAPEIAEGILRQSLEAIREAPEGESNNVLNVESFKVGQLVASGSVSRQYAEGELYKAAKERGKPDYESRATITSGLDGGFKKPLTSPFGSTAPSALISIPALPKVADRWTPSFFTKEDLLNTSNLRKPQLFQDWSTEDIHLTTADGGTGKTTLKLFEAIHLALGERFLGFDCKQAGKTLFITGEDTDKKLASMLGAIIRQMGLFEEGVDNNEKIQRILNSIIIKKDADLCLISKDKQGFIHVNPQAMAQVLQAVDDFDPKMIVFDPISSFWGSEMALNDMNKAVTKFMGQLADRGICVEMINHMGKASSSSKDMTQFAGRGGTGLPSNSRVCRVFHTLTEAEYTEETGKTLTDKQSAMKVIVNKFTDGSPLYNKPFIVVREGYLFRREALTPQRALEAEKQLTDQERIFMFVKDERGMNRYPTKKVITAHFMLSSDKLSKDRVEQALSVLQYTGHLGEKLKSIDNPDQTVTEKCFVITDQEGKEEI